MTGSFQETDFEPLQMLIGAFPEVHLFPRLLGFWVDLLDFGLLDFRFGLQDFRFGLLDLRFGVLDFLFGDRPGDAVVQWLPRAI